MKQAAAICAMVVIGTSQALAQETITLAWDQNPEGDIAGYTLLSGTEPGVYTSAQWVGNVTERTMTIPSGTYHFAVRAMNVSGLESAPSGEVSAVISAQPAPAANWQLVWHNIATGQIVYWDMSESSFRTGGSLGAGKAETSWKVRTSGDLNADGYNDLLFQHDEGYIAVWLLNGNGLLESRLINRISDTNWQIVAAADFNGDTQTDILFQHRKSGNMVVWEMSGLTLTRGVQLSPGQVADVNWRIVGSADFNGDSKPDLLWQNTQTGVITTWLMNGTSLATAGPLSLSGSSDPLWRLKGTGDVNQDGHSDLLWQHEQSNHIAVWYMTGRTFIESKLLTPAQVPAGWVMIGSR